MSCIAAGACSAQAVKPSRFRSVPSKSKAGAAASADPSLIIQSALLEVSRELAQLRKSAQQRPAVDVEARHRRLHMYLADCAAHRGCDAGGPTA